ncbi:MAG: hypothetical protein NVS9B3_01630 [Gemmatimonadaceae bacterium]
MPIEVPVPPIGDDLRAGPADRADLPSLQTDLARSLRNAGKLGASLIASWTVALGIRILMPRYLGPAAYGTFQFADAFTATIFAATVLGVDTYVRKEIPVRPEHASEFFGGVIALRLVLSLILTGVAGVVLAAGGKPVATIHLVLILGVAQFLITVSATYAALLHSVGTVDGLSILNVASKLGWGVGIVVAIAIGAGVVGIAVAMLLSEIVRAGGLALLTARHFELRYAVRLRASLAVLRLSLPYYVATLAQMVYARMDIALMAFLTTDTEVGYYGAASMIAYLAMLLSPLISWLLLPLTSRAGARSDEDLMRVARRAMEVVLSVAFPLSLFLFLGADVLVLRGFGAAYAPAITSVKLQAFSFALTYAAMVGASILIRLQKGWAVTYVALGGMVLSLVLNLLLVPWCVGRFGAGGAGNGAGIALVAVEVYTVGAQTWLLGRQSFDRRSLGVILRTIAVCAAVAIIDALIRRLGAWRLVVDAPLYVLLAAATGAVDVRMIAGVVRRELTRLAVRRRAA